MEKKYWVPAIEKANNIMTIIAKEPRKLKLMEISKRSNINKSSLFTILNTLEELGWVYKEADQTYSLGPKLGFLSAQYIQQFDLTRLFNREADKTVRIIEETIQLSILEGNEIIYIAKKEGQSVVRIASGPGMRFPAHATAMGKTMLSSFSKNKISEMYKESGFKKLTDKTVDNLDDLMDQINEFKKKGYIIETQEAVKGFTCISAPVWNERNEIIAAVSFTMTIDNWEKKSELCKDEIIALAKRLSIIDHD
ncbi:IclR family transcriptional regulator [Aquibacillus sp. 3ASR75-11]|uniref:IclR family transcriptional regulator n=1 Tax=Terrihalobacillus insolitus TaxID=2950438 RepID=A0A9X3WT81_9BACI|nr:IclR family transcriptional regulator [Terrihalobacillus insolitus]MDC3423421.1 IclR family transcriptional regulator [Terrihalobacillus insolitus]